MSNNEPKIQEEIVFVDGFKIRSTLDLEFDMFHKRSVNISPKYGYTPKYYIPEDQIWIDVRYKDETDFLIKTNKFFYEEHYDMPYLEARELAKKELCKTDSVPNFVQKESTEGNLKICYVDGSIIRGHFDPEFSFGGHNFVYDYIKEDEIWLDNLVDQNELKYILIHELKERELMSKGEIYDSAHDIASSLEKKHRRDDGVGFYPGDANYPWSRWPNEKIIEQYIIK